MRLLILHERFNLFMLLLREWFNQFPLPQRERFHSVYGQGFPHPWGLYWFTFKPNVRDPSLQIPEEPAFCRMRVLRLTFVLCACCS